jgi:antitoxin CptB
LLITTAGARPVVPDRYKCFALPGIAPHIARQLAARAAQSVKWRLSDIREDVEMNENRNTRLRRLVYQSSYTGMKETDLLLGRFAAVHLAALSNAELDQYEALLEAGDDRIYAWVVTGEAAPDPHDNRVLDLIKEFKND